MKTYSSAVACVCGLFMLASCGGDVPTPSDTKHLLEFHLLNFQPQEKELKEGQLSLYVDYSTCNVLGQHSAFFQDVSASLVTKTTAYYSIKGSEIAQEDLSGGGVYTLLRNIEEVNYADLKGAALRMASGDCEAVMITDGEYYTENIAKGHENDPYLAEAFKQWIIRGYDVHILSEPYEEPCDGRVLEKKRFYILFTDDRMENNIYDRITRTIDFRQYPGVDEFHLSASHPRLYGESNNSSTQDPTLMSKTEGYGTCEIENWEGCDWGTIEDMLVVAVDDNTGEPLPQGTPIIRMRVDPNSFGCYRIKALGLKVYDINQEYADFYDAMEAKQKVAPLTEAPVEIEHFMKIDQGKFAKYGLVHIAFDQDYFDPNILSGAPNNYFKLDLTVDKIEPIFRQHEDKFSFESISLQGEKNISVASSIKQCLADDEVVAKMTGQVIYTIYIKSEAK